MHDAPNVFAARNFGTCINPTSPCVDRRQRSLKGVFSEKDGSLAISVGQQMKQQTYRILSISTVLAISVLPNAGLSLAQNPRDWGQCIGREGPSVDVVIEGCTAVIQSGQAPPKNLATAFDNRGVAERLKGEYDHALQDYEQALRLNPNNANAHNNRGIIYRIKGDYGRAIADYDEAIWLKNGDFPAAFYNRALSYADKGEYDRALAD